MVENLADVSTRCSGLLQGEDGIWWHFTCIVIAIDTSHSSGVCTLHFFTYPLAHSPLKASFLTSAPSPPLTSTFTYGETNGDRVFVQNPAKGKLARKCTTASTDCHIQIHVQQTSPNTYSVTCPTIIQPLHATIPWHPFYDTTTTTMHHHHSASCNLRMQ